MFENQINIQGRSAKSLSVSGTAAVVTNPLEAGVYAVWSDVDTYIALDRTSSVADDVLTTTGFKITANSPVIPMRVTSPSFLAGIAGSAGTLYYHRVA